MLRAVHASPRTVTPSLARLETPLIKAAVCLAPVVFSLACAASTIDSSPPSPAEVSALEARAEAEDAEARDWRVLGAAYAALGDWSNAEEALNAALEQDPSDVDSEYFLGVTYEGMGRWEEAEAAYQRFLAGAGSEALDAHQRERLAARGAARASVRSAIADEAALSGAVPSPGTVGVFPFVYTGDDPTYQPLGRALSEFLTTDLSQTSRLQVLERSRVQLLTDELELARSDLVDPRTAARSGRLLGAETVVQGTLASAGEDLDITAFAAPVVEGPVDPSREVSEADEVSRFLDMEKAVAIALFASMGIELTPAERERVLRRPTENLEAVLAFGTGLEALDRGDFAAAAVAFQQAVILDPGFAEAQNERLLAEDLQVAAATPPAEAALAAAQEFPEVPVSVADMFRTIENLVPTGEIRDPTVEVLGIEGLIPSRGALEVVVPRPQGNEQ